MEFFSRILLSPSYKLTNLLLQTCFLQTYYLPVLVMQSMVAASAEDFKVLTVSHLKLAKLSYSYLKLFGEKLDSVTDFVSKSVPNANLEPVFISSIQSSS